MKLKLKLTKKQMAITNTAPSDSRPILNNLLIRNGEVIAADGFMLVSTPYEGEHLDTDVLIPADAVREIQNGGAEVNIDGGDVTVTAKAVLKTGVVYPDLKSAFSMLKNAPTGHVALDAKYLRRLCDFAEETQGGIITLFVRGDRQPVEFMVGATQLPDYHGLIMPMYTQVDLSNLYPVAP